MATPSSQQESCNVLSCEIVLKAVSYLAGWGFSEVGCLKTNLTKYFLDKGMISPREQPKVVGYKYYLTTNWSKLTLN